MAGSTKSASRSKYSRAFSEPERKLFSPITPRTSRDGSKHASGSRKFRRARAILMSEPRSAMNPAAERERPRSQQIFDRAREILVGGVDSPVRAFGAVGGTPIVVERAAGCRLWDADGNAYVDYVCSWGALILGHAHSEIVAALAEQAARGTSYGMTTASEVELATMIRRGLPSCERVRFVNSGTEATMSAVRLARAATGRDLIVKCIGGYHGHADGLLAEAGSGALTLGTPSSPGIAKPVAACTLLAP